MLTAISLHVYYDHEDWLLIQSTDASPCDIGAALNYGLLNGTEASIAFYSKTITSAEIYYAKQH